MRAWPATLLAAVLLASACSSDTDTDPLAASSPGVTRGGAATNAPAAATEAPHGEAADGADIDSVPTPASDASPGEPPTGGDGSGSVDGEDKGPEKPPPFDFPGKSKVPAGARLAPPCVERGATMSLTVETEPEAAVGFQAVYSDGEGGGPPPLGAGYGGNDKGFASKGGTFTAEWVVSTDAPVGRGRVDVVVGYDGEFGYDGPHFAVADEDGKCPSAWIRDGGGSR